MTPVSLEVGWLPVRFDATVGAISLTTLEDFDAKIVAIEQSDCVDQDWIYPPLMQNRWMGMVSVMPYPSRIFGLPKTHRLTHSAPNGPNHLEFLVWCLSFIFGLRLTSLEAGFLDATPTKIGKLTDLALTNSGQKRALILAEEFWQKNLAHPSRSKRWGAAVHALLLGQGPRLLQFERFIYLYGALDCCFALTEDLIGPLSKSNRRHSYRIEQMCQYFEMPIPSWAVATSGKSSAVADIRNPIFHESLFMDAPLGFALHGIGTGQNLTLEMSKLISRLLVALLGDHQCSYVQSRVDTYQLHGWTPSI